MEAKYPRRELNSGPSASEAGALSAELRGLEFVVGMTRFERATLCSQSRCATKLRHIPFRVVRPTRAWCRQRDSNPLTRKNGFTVRRASPSAPCRHCDLGRARTADPLGVNQTLSQLSYETELLRQ